jgi:bacterioferritin-associated ferredoxin
VYICICNGISDRQIKVAVDSGASNWKQVHSFFGHKPNCGKCELEIIKIIGDKLETIIKKQSEINI